MEIIKLYINLNNSLIDLQKNQKHQNAKTNQCNDYFNCVKNNSYLVEQYKKLSPEITRNFVNQHFDINTLSNNFNRLETIDTKIRDLQRSMPEISKYMKTESANIESLKRQYANDLHFGLMNEAEDWIDSILHELERIKQERIDKKEKWKSAGKAIFKYAAMGIVFFFTFLWRMVNKKD